MTTLLHVLVPAILACNGLLLLSGWVRSQHS